MKEILISLLSTGVAILLLVGCKGAVDRERMTQREAENMAIVNNFRTVEYNGHSFIVYREIYGTKNFGGLTHDPDCKCNKIENHHDTVQ